MVQLGLIACNLLVTFVASQANDHDKQGATEMIQGQSECTEEKARGLSSIFHQQLSIFRELHLSGRINKPIVYFHFDLHGGCGHNHEVDVIGSPVLFDQMATRYDVPFKQHVAELDASRCCQLATALSDSPHSFPLCGDNKELVECVPDIIASHGENPRYAIGSILIDPNGATDQIPWEQLQEATRACPKLDILFNYPGTAFKRISPAHAEYVGVAELKARLNKQHMLVRDPVGCWHFTLMVLRNRVYSGNKTIQLWDEDSSEGQRALAKCRLTSKDFRRWQEDQRYPRQLQLFKCHG